MSNAIKATATIIAITTLKHKRQKIKTTIMVCFDFVAVIVGKSIKYAEFYFTHY